MTPGDDRQSTPAVAATHFLHTLVTHQSGHNQERWVGATNRVARVHKGDAETLHLVQNGGGPSRGIGRLPMDPESQALPVLVVTSLHDTLQCFRVTGRTSHTHTRVFV